MTVTVFEQWTVEEQGSFRDQVRAALSKGEAAVTFTKADGSQRVLRGTTNLDYVPASQQPKGGRPENPEVQTVYDLDKNEWRSFRWDRVSDFKIL
jgi:hypothetical protein